MISQTAEYALRAVVYLAMHSSSAFTAQQIAAGTLVPAAYLAKILRSLARAHLVSSQRGVGGGFSLARSASQITLLEVLNAVDPVARIRVCPLGLEQHEMELCALHKQLDDVAAQIERVFQETTIADLLNKPTTSTPLTNCKVGVRKIASKQ